MQKSLFCSHQASQSFNAHCCLSVQDVGGAGTKYKRKNRILVLNNKLLWHVFRYLFDYFLSQIIIALMSAALVVTNEHVSPLHLSKKHRFSGVFAKHFAFTQTFVWDKVWFEKNNRIILKTVSFTRRCCRCRCTTIATKLLWTAWKRTAWWRSTQVTASWRSEWGMEARRFWKCTTLKTQVKQVRAMVSFPSFVS